MASKWKFIDIIEYFKKVAFSIKTATLKAFTSNDPSKTYLSDKLKIGIVNKINKSTTSTINRYFALTTIIFCLVIVTISYYEQHYKFEQELVAKTKFVHLSIEETIKNYQTSLNTLAKTILKNQRYRDNDKVIQLLKLTFTNDEYISLIPLYWYPINDLSRSFNAYGSTAPDKTFLEKIKQANSFFMYDKLDEKGERILLLILPLLEEHNLNNTKDSNLVGHLALSVKISSILHAIENNLSTKDLLKLDNKNESMYFIAQSNSFNIIQKPLLEKYQFAYSINLLNTPYTVTTGKEKSEIIESFIQVALQRCAIILSLSFAMLLIYNLIERKKIKERCTELFNEEVLLLGSKVEKLNTKLSDLNQKSANTTKFIQSYHHADTLITSIEKEIKQETHDSIQAIKDSLNFKQLKSNDDLTIDMVNKVFGNIYAIVENISNNVVCYEDKITEVNLTDLFTEVLAIFEPIISQRSIKIINKVADINVHINELTLKQILITLFNKALYFVPSDSTITIIASKNISRNSVIIEFTDNGIGFNELLFKDRAYQGKNALLPRVSNIELDGKIIETLVKTNLKGDLKVTSTRSGNKITLLFPIEREREDKVIPFPKIIGGNL
jgi:hypothetical protein